MRSYPILGSDGVGPLRRVASPLGHQLLSTLQLLIHLVIIITIITIIALPIIIIITIALIVTTIVRSSTLPSGCLSPVDRCCCSAGRQLPAPAGSDPNKVSASASHLPNQQLLVVKSTSKA